MKKRLILLISLITMAMASCQKEVEFFNVPEKINVKVEDEVYIEEGKLVFFEFEVLPADARFNFDLSKKADIALETISVAAPQHVELNEVKQISKEKGLYRATVRDLEGKEIYAEKLVLRILCQNPQGKWVKTSSKVITFTNIQKVPSVIKFLEKHNATAINEDLSADVAIGQETFIRSPKITSSELIASFDVEGDIFVNGVKQISGVTVNDFSQPVKYTLKNGDSFTVQVRHSGLPMVFIETAGGAAIPDKHSDWLSGSKLKIYNSDWTLAYEGDMGIRGRGNSTWSYPKKPYAIKLDSKAEILGMPKHKRWVLLANWLDRTLLRNCCSFELASRSGLVYTPRGQFVEVFINGEHNGNYFLCEQIKVDKNRVNVDEHDPAVVDGGYLFELDSYYDEAFKFKSSVRKLPYMFKDPDEDITDAQFEFVQNYVNTLEAALYDDERFAAGEYRNYMDVESFVDWWLVMELTGIWEPNHPKSSYMHKNSGGKLVMGPVWDFDWETYMPSYASQYRISTALYYERLLQDPYFVSVVKQRWSQYKESFRTLPEFIQQKADEIRSSESFNYAMWPVTSNVNKDINLPFDSAVERMIQGYNQKFNWLDSAIGKM